MEVMCSRIIDIPRVLLTKLFLVVSKWIVLIEDART